MKLRTKISLGNLLINLLFLLVVGVSLFFVVRHSVFTELDEHLLNHKHDLIQRFESNQLSLDAIDQIGSIGTYEWIELTEFTGDDAEPSNQLTTVKKTRFEGDAAERYRRLSTIITLNNTPYQLVIYEEISEWESIALSIIAGIFVLLVIWFVILTMGSEVIIRKTLQPFFETISKLRNIRSDKDFNTTFPKVSTSEFDELNATLNSMLGELEASFIRQKQFIQNVSHELLTPLSIIRHKTDELLNNPHLDEAGLIEISKIQQTTIRLKKLANALLMISRVENRHYSIAEKIDASKVIEEVTTELRDFLLSKNIRVDMDISSQMMLTGNTELFSSLVYNVLQNAVYHTSEKTEITIRLFDEAGALHLTIQDSGPGIPQEELDFVFERFQLSAENGGTGHHGLGLAIVKSICKLHDWSCYFEKRESNGAVFHLVAHLDK